MADDQSEEAAEADRDSIKVVECLCWALFVVGLIVACLWRRS